MDPDIGKATQFKPGQTGNPNGRPRLKPLTDEFKRRLEEENGNLSKELIGLAIDKALAGDFRFWQELMNRSDGKVADHVDMTTNGESINQHPGLDPEDAKILSERNDGPKE